MLHLGSEMKTSLFQHRKQNKFVASVLQSHVKHLGGKIALIKELKS